VQPDPRLTEWHRVVAERDWTALDGLLDEQVEFHSPFVWKPKLGRMAALFILSNVSEIFEDFTYHREWSDGDSLALEFSAGVDGLGVKGIDLIRFRQSRPHRAFRSADPAGQRADGLGPKDGRAARGGGARLSALGFRPR
jgi:hypothetical protein